MELDKMLHDKRVQEYHEICLSLEPVGHLPKIKYAKMMLHTVQTWLENKEEPVSIYLCAPESYESLIRAFNLALKETFCAEDITVETTTRIVSLTMIGSEDSDFQQAEEKIRKHAQEIRLKTPQVPIPTHAGSSANSQYQQKSYGSSHMQYGTHKGSAGSADARLRTQRKTHTKKK